MLTYYTFFITMRCRTRWMGYLHTYPSIALGAPSESLSSEFVIRFVVGRMCTARRYYFLCTGRGRQTFQSLCCRVVCCPVASHNGGRATTWQYHSSGQVQNSASVGRLLHGIQEHPAMMPNRQRVRPNILITGTPGVGKTTMASTLAVSPC